MPTIHRPSDQQDSMDNVRPLDVKTDLLPIAGDNLISTQLDLARAFIETNQKEEAQAILELVMSDGTPTQKEEAKELVNFL